LTVFFVPWNLLTCSIAFPALLWSVPLSIFGAITLLRQESISAQGKIVPTAEIELELASPYENAKAPLVNDQSAQPTLSEELAKLSDLHKQGVLSDDEFMQAKARVLDT